MAYLSSHFTFQEVIKSSIADRYGIDNSIPADILPAIMNTAAHMELVRLALRGNVIDVDSWYRCLELNQLLKSKDTSQHLKGEAVDFICPDFGAPLEIVRTLSQNFKLLQFDQLILEHTWVHISFNSIPDGKPRGQVLTLLSDKTYAVGITDKYGKEIV